MYARQDISAWQEFLTFRAIRGVYLFKVSEKVSSMRTIRQSTAEYARGLAGGFLLSLPLLYTMEVWWQGFVLPPLHLVAFVGVTFVLLLGYNRFSGMRRDASFVEVIIDSVEELGIGIVLSTIILFLLNKIWIGMPLEEAFGKITIEAMTVAIGVSVGTAQLFSGEAEEDIGMDGDNQEGEFNTRTFFEQIFVSFCGAILVGSNIAPTEEVLEIAVDSSSLHLVGLAVLSMAVIGVILYISNFSGADKIEGDATFSQRMETVLVVYAIALVSSGLLLWMYGHLGGASIAVFASEVIVLAFVASLGASAGRLLIQ